MSAEACAAAAWSAAAFSAAAWSALAAAAAIRAASTCASAAALSAAARSAAAFASAAPSSAAAAGTAFSTSVCAPLRFLPFFDDVAGVAPLSSVAAGMLGMEPAAIGASRSARPTAPMKSCTLGFRGSRSAAIA